MNKNQPRTENGNGFTLIEILVVLVIATVVISLAIPRIRTVNKERNMRETARIVGSLFANASQRAVIDGSAGIRITRNPRFVQGTRQFAATEISMLRRVPNYVGDAVDADINNGTDAAAGDLFFEIEIDLPFEQFELEIIKAGDSISFGGSSYRYRIEGVHPGENEDGTSNATTTTLMRLQLNRGSGNYLPEPVDGSSYSIFRQPRILRSSTANLPDNYIIDLRYSGFEVLDGFGAERPAPGGVGSIGPAGILERQLTTVFEPAPTDFTAGTTPVVENYSIDIFFDEEGSVDFVLYTEAGDEDGDLVFDETVARVPLGPIYFLITEAPNSLDNNQEIATADAQALWVTVSNRTGSANIGYNDPNAKVVSGVTIGHEGISVNQLSVFYFADVDTEPPMGPDLFIPSGDRDQFNAMIRESRNGAATSTANQ